jgi:lysozyme
MITSDAGVALIKRYESCRLKPYLCPANVWTVGWGHTGPDVDTWAKAGKELTQHQADSVLAFDLERFETCVARVCPKATGPQFSACVSLAFNIGTDAFAKSTVARRLNAGDIQGAADAFLMWTKARVKGELKELPGLLKRRHAERKLFLEIPA